eukprot:TRINITY_DN259_c0_g1_i1.p1 TRINITY_DN259_c0_g1~~TRINITY_DN259_c0_g1_i1.p1  ORF type:complete len:448 (+),score=158.57 TRINITY_DN259_c0_g1_i1:76-1344(+)
MTKLRHKHVVKKRLREAQRPPQAGGKLPPAHAAVPEAFSFQQSEQLCKELGTDDEQRRDRALEHTPPLLKALEGAPAALPLEYAKVWRGLFYCMWHSDKPLVQLACADKIADLHGAVSPQHVAEFARQGWKCMEREWPTIDKWRIDKFYSLMRRMLNRQLRALGEADSGTAGEILAVLREVYDSPRTGIGSHISDCLVDECVAVQLPQARFRDLFRDVLLAVLSASPTQVHCRRIEIAVINRLCGEIVGAEESEEAIEWMSGVLWEELAPLLQRAALARETRSANRERLSRLGERTQDLLQQAGEAADLAELDSDEEQGEIRAEAARRLELRMRAAAPGSEAARQAERAERRRAMRELAKAKRQGKQGEARKVAHDAKQKGLKITKPKKRKGKGRLRDALAVAHDGHALAKQQKTRKRKRRI